MNSPGKLRKLNVVVQKQTNKLNRGSSLKNGTGIFIFFDLVFDLVHFVRSVYNWLSSNSIISITVRFVIFRNDMFVIQKDGLFLFNRWPFQ
jgi:hypothetical protein